ncbi:MAG: response regulator [Planctomycetes bacterium]|nr:response regulator [Planctomycetota bacterium]
MSNELVGKKILLVDDDADILSAMQTALVDTGATLETASDGDSAVRKIVSETPDLVVLDMMLPKRSGFLVMERLKRRSGSTDRPRVIMITGNEGTRHRVYAESLGVDIYLKKPFRMEKLVEGIMNLLGAVAE